MALSRWIEGTAYGFPFTQSYYFGFGYFGCHEVSSAGNPEADSLRVCFFCGMALPAGKKQNSRKVGQEELS